MSTYYRGAADHRGVHENSGIPNRPSHRRRQLDINQLAEAATYYPASAVQRTGLMIEHAATEIDNNINLEPILHITQHRTERTLLSPAGPRRGTTNPRWHVVINTEIEPDR